jgi:hypothetical protein
VGGPWWAGVLAVGCASPSVTETADGSIVVTHVAGDGGPEVVVPTGPPPDDPGTPEPTESTAACDPPEVWDLGALEPVPSGALVPAWIGVWMDGIVDGGSLVDMSFDGVDSSAWLVFTLYDDDLDFLCQAIFDASDAAEATAVWATDSGGEVFAAWELTLDAADGFTSCPELNEGAFGTEDVRTWLAAQSWGVGFGALEGLQPLLQALVESASPGTWASAWEPYAFATYVHVDGWPAAVEAGYLLQFPHGCFDVASTAAPLPRPEAADEIIGYVGAPGDLVVFDADLL